MLRVLRRRGDAKLLAFAAQMVATGAMTTGVCALGQVCARDKSSHTEGKQWPIIRCSHAQKIECPCNIFNRFFRNILKSAERPSVFCRLTA
jgi:hypothetical protein